MVTDIDETFAALAEPTRRRIVDLLRDRPLRAGEIADKLNMSGPATSRHLRVLRRGGIIGEIDVEDDARVRVYQLRPESFTALHTWLDHVEQSRGTGPTPDGNDNRKDEEGAST